MRKTIPTIVLCAIFFTPLLHAQGVRWDLGTPGSAGVTTVTAGSGYPPIFAVPNVTLNFCAHPANAVPCTNYVTTYTDLTLGTACATNAQVVLQGTTSCVATGDAGGNLGVNLATGGTYDYTLTVSGVTSGPYVVSVGGGNGGAFCALTGGTSCVMTGSIVGNLNFTSSSDSFTGAFAAIDATENWIVSGLSSTLGDVVAFATADANAGVIASTLNGVLIKGFANRFRVDSTGFYYETGNSAPGIPAYANNTAALAGGLTEGHIYRTGADPDQVAIVDATGGTKPVRTCQTGLGDGLNAIPSGTYLQYMCVNDSGVTWTIAAIHCFTDNAGSSTLAAKNNAATSLLTGPITCNATKAGGGAAGTLSGTTTLASGDAVSFTFVADGTSTQTTWTVSFTQ